MTKELYSLSNPQKSIWLTQAYYQGMSIENNTGTVVVSQKLNFTLLAEAINLFVERNESYRLKFLEKDGEIYQYVAPYSKFVWEEFNVSSEQDIKKIEKKLSDTPFEVFDNFLFTFKLFKFEDGHGGFFVCMHHLISDAWTACSGADEIMAIYEDLINNTQNSPLKKPSYIEFLSSEQEYLQSEKFEKDKAFWNEIFESIPEASTIPTVKESLTNAISCSSKRKQFVIPKETISLINEFCKENKASLFNFFMGVYSLYISKVSNQNDIVLGTPILNRSNFKEKQTSGMFVSTIPVRISINKENSFANFISELGSDFLKLFRHQKYPYQSLLEDLRKKDSSIPNLYNVLISYQNVRSTQSKSSIPYSINWVANSCISDDIDIHLTDMNDTGSITVAYDYLLSKYSLSDICNMHARILHMVNQILENNSINLQDIEIVTPQEKQKLLYDFNNTKTFYDKEKTISELFENQVLKTPDNTAIVFGNQSLTYKELNEKANSLANVLRQKGVSNNDILGIMVPRSLEMIVAILAVLKAGGCYIPIDPEYPKDRIEYMLENSNAKMLLTFESLNDKVSYKNKFFVELSNDLYNSNKENLENINSCEDLAYVIYTSGSTGKPKGVMLSHKNVNNFIVGMADKINFAGKTIVSVTTISFDIFVLESILPLICGLKIVIANENEQTNVKSFNKLCVNNKVNIIQTTPSRFKVLISDNNELNYLRDITDILVGGEAFPKSLLADLKKLTSCNIYDVYGPTETTVWSTVKDLTLTNEITIGTPIANTSCYIFNNSNKLLPEYFAGNLFIGGDGLSSGYLNNKNLTDEKFILNPYNENELIYNTGDLAYYNSDGELIHLGRNDFQVKINGHRIELEEIENEILKNKDIKNCVVVKQSFTDTHEYLCAYYTCKSNVDISLLRAELSKNLPNYMVPQYFMELPELPYTPNGKIDRKKLPKIEANKSQKEITESRNSIDNSLIEILKELLGLNEISITDSFFEIGGDSLTAINLCTKVYSLLNVQIYVKDILENPIIKDLSDLISNKDCSLPKEIIPKVKKKDYYPVSSAQARTFFASSISGDNSILYNISGGLIFNKLPNKEKLQTAFDKLVARHSSLRTYFEMNNEDVVQKVLDEAKLNLEFEETSSTIDVAFKEFNTAFDLSKAPLFKAKLLKLNDGTAFLTISMHHIIADGTSLSILMNDLCKLYNEASLDKITIEYKDYAVFENQKLASNNFKDAENYWVNQFKDEVPVLNMPTKQRPAVQSFEGDKVYTNFDETSTSKINALAEKLGITPNMLLLSCYYILLYKYTMQDDIVVGTPIANRPYAELSNVVGMFVNTLPIRTKFTSNLTFNNFVDIIKSNCLEAYKYQDYPFDVLVNKLQLKRDISRNPLFDTSFIYQNNGYLPAKFDGIDAKYYIPNTKISKFDLSLEVVPNNNTLDLTFEYATKLFDKSFVKTMSNHYINIVNSVLEKSDLKISEIDMLSNDEKNKILYEFNNTKMDYPKDKTIANLFEEQVEKTPDNIAVVFEDKKLTYKQLNEKANSLAFVLREKGISRNDIVGIMVSRSLEMIVAILAVLKAGGCYIPIDPDYPTDRIEYMLENSKAKLLLVKENLESSIDFSNKLYIDLSNNIYLNNKENIKSISLPEDLSYIIYTSGSTGKPKGVCLYHKSLTNLAYYLNENVEFLKDCSSQRNIVSVTTVSFDIFIFETLICLQKGLKIIISTEEEQHIPSALSNLIQKENIEIIQMTPSRMQIFLDNLENTDIFKSLKYVVLAGEALPDSLKTHLLNYGIKKVYNGYGPSETTVFSTFTDVTDFSKINIGKPLANTQTYVLNKDMLSCPTNVPGELYIAGDGVGKGYLNNLDLTNLSYLNNPFENNSIMYKTGDLCSYNNDGTINYLGRIDNQVKIRGLRIELGEIENKILSYPNIQKCCVIKQTLNSRDFISAYYISNKRINVSELRKYISSSLPKYMVPSYFTSLEDFPYTPNGKINKKALPLPKEILNSTDKTDFVAPKTDLEKDFVRVWEEVLNISPIGITDNFFELGGDSILAMNLNIELKKITDSISYADIFKFPTIEELIKKVSSNKEDYDFKYLEKNYDKYADILNLNKKVPKVFELKHISSKSVLLAGATGFLGMHVLDSFIKNEKGNIYCLIREENNLTAETKLYQKLNYYFGSKYNNLIGKRIFAITADICKPGFGLNQEDLLKIANNIDTIINCAARVAHYGKYSDFYAVNVQSVKYMIDFCKSFNKRFYHISTLSVSGNAFDSTIISQNIKEKTFFSESNFYIGQSLENVYIRSKFEAECLVLDSVLDGVDSYILRVGNLMPRYKDGVFQENIKDNAFINRILSFIRIGSLPDYIMSEYLEFSPVDITANSIIKLVTHPNKNNRIFHLFNHNHVYINKGLKYFKLLNPNLNILPEEEFKKTLKTLLKSKTKKELLNSLINDLDKDLHLQYKTDIIIKSDITLKYLSKIGFNWPKISNRYMMKFLEILRRNL